MTKYEIYEHAGKVPYSEWKESGIVVPIFDKDGTLTHANQLNFVDEVVDELAHAELPDIYPNIALVSNNHDHSHVLDFSRSLERKLGVNVYAISRAGGYKKKPDPMMGFEVVKRFGVKPEQLGVIGDRLLTDVRFAHNLGAGAVALCDKAGEGDAKWVPMLRKVEALIVARDIRKGRAVSA